jgi:hypothetical protein
MRLEDIKFPIFVLHSDEIEVRDGLLFCDTQIVDDKNMKIDIKYKTVRNVEKKEVATLIWVEGIPFPFEEKRPNTSPYVGIAYVQNRPSFIYDFVAEKRKDTWRKI